MPRQPHAVKAAVLVAAFVVGLVAGCGNVPSKAAPTPADFEGLVAELDRQHIAVSDVVSGDTGCNDPELVGPAIGLDASGADQSTPVRIHLFLFRDGAAYDRQRQAVDRCSRSFVTNPADYVAIDARPFVAVSAGPWAPGFTDAVRRAITRAAGG